MFDTHHYGKDNCWVDCINSTGSIMLLLMWGRTVCAH